MDKEEDQDSGVDYSDDEMAAPVNNTSLSIDEPQLSNAQAPHRKLINGSFEMLYILFSFYRKELENLAKQYDCQIRISMGAYLVTCQDADKTQMFTQCLGKIAIFIKQIVYAQIVTSPNPRDAIKYCNSPHFQAIMKRKKITLVFFNNKVYGFSTELFKDDIKNTFKKLSRENFIYSVRFGNSKVLKPKWYTEIYAEICEYIKKTFDHYADFFKERNVVVELASNNRYIVNLIGSTARHLMGCKNQVKNILQSLVCVVVRDTQVEEKKLRLFLEKASKYPIHFKRYTQRSVLMISKDNILKQIVTKSANFMRYLGLTPNQSPNSHKEFGEQRRGSQIGIYIIFSASFEIKIKNLRENIREKGFDIYSNLGIKYMHRVFSQNNEEPDNKIYAELLLLALTSLEEKKDRFQLMNRLVEEVKEDRNKQPDNPLRYIIVSGRQEDNQLTKLLKRDVLVEKVQMKKEHMIAFNVNEGKQEVVYWTRLQSGEQGVEIPKEALQKGCFFKGRRRISEDGVKDEIYDVIITII